MVVLYAPRRAATRAAPVLSTFTSVGRLTPDEELKIKDFEGLCQVDSFLISKSLLLEGNETLGAAMGLTRT